MVQTAKLGFVLALGFLRRGGEVTNAAIILPYIAQGIGLGAILGRVWKKGVEGQGKGNGVEYGSLYSSFTPGRGKPKS